MSKEHKESETDQEPSTVWEALASWRSELPPWLQFILQTAIAQGTLSAEQVDRAYALFLIHAKLAEEQANDNASGIAAAARPSAPLVQALVLTGIDEMQGVNALPSGCGMSFGEGLTVVYGPNGAGKSGFIRLIANACFSRNCPDILGDIYAQDAPPPANARFQFSIGGQAQPALALCDVDENSELKRIAVFDSAVANHHITQTAAFEYRPAGFDVFPEMARVCGLLKERLDADIASRTQENDFAGAYVEGDTEVSTAIATLGADTDLDKLRELAKFGDSEKSRFAEIDNQLIALKSRSPDAAIAALIEAKADIEALRASMAKAAKHFSEDAVARRASLIVEAQDAIAAAKALGTDQFKRSFFNAVGTEEWSAFVNATGKLAAAEGAEYPSDQSHCLLCERPLDRDSKAHIEKLLLYAEGDARRTAAEAQGKAAQEARELEDVDLDIFSPASRVKGHIRKLAPDTDAVVADAITRLKARRSAALTALEKFTNGETPCDIGDVIGALESLEKQVWKDIERLKSTDVNAAMASLSGERLLLRHRQVLAGQIGGIQRLVENSRWVRRAENAKSQLRTRHITDKEKQLFAAIVGDGYRSRFEEECRSLDCEVPVELRTRGRDGKTVRLMEMRGGHSPSTILSEGEQRGVAIADFLTEVGLNPAAAGVVFDDPVTSLDHQRRELIAKRLVKEADSRQVIVFTHDLVFLHMILEAAEGREVVTHWVQRSGDGAPGDVSLNDAPRLAKKYESTGPAEEALADATASTGSAREDAIKRGMGALRTTLEEAVVKRLFKNIVPRWSDRVMVTKLPLVNWDNDKADEIKSLYEDLSRFIEGHSHTDEARGASPDISALQSRIDQVRALIKWARAERS